jgi:predicted 2-oxoglutarate/Fe(II)-dependent dioxygenase YbiX
LSPIIENYLKNYLSSHVALDLRIAKISPLEINKYPTDTEMFFHTDHDSAGFPFLTMIASMNDNFDGGEFVLWDDEVVKLEAGDLLLFPSMFAYPHRITKITKGTRYSVISWAY